MLDLLVCCAGLAGATTCTLTASWLELSCHKKVKMQFLCNLCGIIWLSKKILKICFSKLGLTNFFKTNLGCNQDVAIDADYIVPTRSTGSPSVHQQLFLPRSLGTQPPNGGRSKMYPTYPKVTYSEAQFANSFQLGTFSCNDVHCVFVLYIVPIVFWLEIEICLNPWNR